MFTEIRLYDWLCKSRFPYSYFNSTNMRKGAVTVIVYLFGCVV